MLNKFSEMIRGNLTKIQRQKIVALVTIEVHARDVIEKMIKSGCGDVSAFEWLSQLRLYWDKVLQWHVTCLLVTSLLSAELNTVKSVLCGHPFEIANRPLNVGWFLKDGDREKCLS